jgi:hypothetical protein
MKLLIKNFIEFRLSKILVLIFLYTNLNGQTSSRSYIPPSPQASSLGVFVDGNLGNYSGRADVNVPLYEINTGSIKMPIGLSYYTGGIKSDDDGSWVGLNWALNSGGVVARVKRDKDDFGVNGFYKVNPNSRPCEKIFDQEPDMFFFNFNGYSGKFLIIYNNGSYNIKQISKSSLRIIFEPLGWTIITPEGIKYLFRKEEKTKEQLITSSGEGNEIITFTSAWFLTKIIALNGEQIDFSYNIPQIKTKKELIIGGSSTTVTTSPKQAYNCLTQQQLIGIQYAQQIWSKSIIETDEIILDKIQFSNGTVVFNTEARIDLRTLSGYGSRLRNIQIYKGTSLSSQNILTTYNFEYDYYTTNQPNLPDNLTKRLRLIKVTESNGNMTKPPYSFFYGGDFIYSAKNSNGSNLGYSTESTICMLSKIKFPTGGFTNFTYSPHQLTDISGQALNFGCRIKEISQDDGITSNINVKKFDYFNGKLLGRYQPFTISGGASIMNFPTCPYILPGQSVWVFVSTIISQNLTSLSELGNNESFGYDKVVLTYGQNGQNGKIEYEYYNDYPNLPIYPEVVSQYIPVSNSTQKSGSLKSIKEFKQSGSSYILTNQSESNYISSDQYFILAKRMLNNVCYDYNINTEWLKYILQVDSKFDESGNNPMIQTTNLVYDNSDNLLPTSITTLNSKSETVVTTYKYPKEVAANTTGSVYNTMIAKNFISPVIEQKITNNGNVTSVTTTDYKDWNLLGMVIAPEKITVIKGQPSSSIINRKEVTNFNLYDSKGNPLDVSEDKGTHKSYIWGYKGKYPIAEIENANYSSIGFEGFEDNNDLFWRDWSAYSEVNLMADGHTGNFSYNCKKPPYNNELMHHFLPPRKGKYEFSCWIKTSSSFNGPAYLLLSTVDANAGAYASTFPFGFSESFKTFPITNTGGVWKYFSGVIDLDKIYLEIGNTNTQLAIRTSLFNTVLNDSYLIDDIKFYPVDSKMSTYTYDPLVGMTSATFSNNMTMYYEYDKLNRVKIIRDEDKNIIKKIEYQYNTYAHSTPVWQASGNTRCMPCSTNNNFWVNLKELELKDLNPQSVSYNQSLWVGVGVSTECDPASWQDISYYCELDNNGENTGNWLLQQKDISPCSPTFNQTRVVNTGYHPVSCPPACSNACIGEGYRCVFGSCEYGYKIITSSYYDFGLGMWECIYHYEWSDGMWSQDYSFYDYYQCY